MGLTVMEGKRHQGGPRTAENGRKPIERRSQDGRKPTKSLEAAVCATSLDSVCNVWSVRRHTHCRSEQTEIMYGRCGGQPAVDAVLSIACLFGESYTVF